jgi:MFS family permease
LATGFAAAGLGALMAPWLRRRFNGRIAPAVVLAQGMMGLSVLLLAAAGQFVFAAVALVASYFFNGLMSPYLAELLHEHVPAERRTTMVSVRSLSLQSGGFVGALTLPGLAAMHGIPTAWMLAGSIVGLAALLYAGIPNRATAPAPHIQAVSTPVT